MPKRENLRRIDEHITRTATVETGDTAMGIGPATCTVSTTNAATALSHTHEITTSDDGSVYPAILATNDSGDCTIYNEMTAYQFTAEWVSVTDTLMISTGGSIWAGAEGGTVTMRDNLRLNDDLLALRGATTYTVYPMAYLTAGLAAPGWSGFHDHGDDGTLDISSLFSAPAGVKAVLLKAVLSDGTDGDIVGIGPTYASQTALEMHYSGAGNTDTALAIVPCNATGDICVYCLTGGSINIDLTIWGYAL